MKGMRKIVRGSGILEVLQYVFIRDSKHKKSPGILVGGNLSSSTPAKLAQEFNTVFQLRPDIRKPVWHNALRLPCEEKISTDEWIKISDEYMLRMGFSDFHPRSYVLHDDDEGQHVHIVASRVSLASELYLGRNENLRSTQVISRLETQFGLTITKSASFNDAGKVVMPERASPKKAEIERAVRTGFAPVRLRLQAQITAAKSDKPTLIQFLERLQLSGVSVLPNVASTGRISGLAFGVDSVWFKGSELGKNFTWSSLEKDIRYDENRDSPHLRSIAVRARGLDDRNSRATAKAHRNDEILLNRKSVSGTDSEPSRAESQMLNPRPTGSACNNTTSPAVVRKPKLDTVDNGTTTLHSEVRRISAAHRRDEHLNDGRWLAVSRRNNSNLRAIPETSPSHPISPATTPTAAADTSIAADVMGAWRPNRQGSDFWLNQQDFEIGNLPAFKFEPQPIPSLKLTRYNDSAILAMLRVADDAWDGQFEVMGSEEFIRRAHELMKEHQLGIYRSALLRPSDSKAEECPTSFGLESGMR